MSDHKLAEALLEKVKRLTDLADAIGRSRGSSNYAQNTNAVVRFCALEDEVARDIKSLAAHEAEQQADLKCTRSHPHENMNAECEALTIKASADNAAAQKGSNSP